MKTGFIGVGNMGSALVEGFLSSGSAAPVTVRVFDIDGEKAERLQKTFKLAPAESSEELAGWADAIVLCVKPGEVKRALSGIKRELSASKLLVSIAAGITTAKIEKAAGIEIPVVRAMPNTPALVNLGITALCPGRFAGRRHLGKAEKIFSAAGKVIMTSEDNMNAVTAVSGSGPAYLFYLAESLEEAGAEAGLSAGIIRPLVAQTLYGAAAMMAITGNNPAALREKVTSPGGTTEAAVRTLEEGGFDELIIKAVKNAAAKAVELEKKSDC